uniref:Craniofacial development protein 2-like n=1 Tax=Nicotiana tabacum TaxID=4097 RepID=A0A1S4AZ57_TOBAC|nr:PREDICTED: uncharacterized protein LOC107802754 [Nicotiana tabacum]
MCPGDKGVGSKARDADGCKLWYSRIRKGKNAVGILVDRDLREFVIEVWRVNDRLMTIKLSLASMRRMRAWMRRLKSSYSEVHGGFGFGDSNGGGTSLLDFAKAFELVIANSSFLKREEHLVIFRSAMEKISD